MQSDRVTREQSHFDDLAHRTGGTWWGHATPAGRERLKRRASLIWEWVAGYVSPRILEIGCGAGALTAELVSLGVDIRLIGCDVSRNAVSIARQRCGGNHSVTFEVVDATRLGFKDSSMDAVVGNSVLHHIAYDTALREIFRVLKPGGCFWFSEPNMLNPQIAVEKKLRVLGRILQNSEDETAFFRWPLIACLHEIGYLSITITPYDFLHPITPAILVPAFDKAGRLFEKMPVVREIAGSLWIRGCKPGPSVQSI